MENKLTKFAAKLFVACLEAADYLVVFPSKVSFRLDYEFNSIDIGWELKITEIPVNNENKL